MVLVTERLLLRPWNIYDADSLYEYARDPRVGPIAGWPAHSSVYESIAVILDVFSAEETYAVCLNSNNLAIGCVGLFPSSQTEVEMNKDELEIGFWLGVPFWGNGLIPEAVRKLQERAFLELGCSVMWCGHYEGNTRSQECIEKCGFTYHHTEKDKPCDLMGDVRTEHFYRLTREEWLNSNAPAAVSLQ